MTSYRLRSERFRETVAQFLRVKMIPILPRVPLDRKVPRLSDAVAQASHLLAGDHFSITVSTGTPLDVSGKLRQAESNARLDDRPYPVAILQRHGVAGTGQQFAVLSLDTLAALVQQIEFGPDVN